MAIVPEVTVKQDVADKTLAALTIEGGNLSHPIYSVQDRQKSRSLVLTQFSALLKPAS